MSPWVCLCCDVLPDSNPALACRFRFRPVEVCGRPTSTCALEFLLLSASDDIDDGARHSRSSCEATRHELYTAGIG